jgi:hypothetical protein
MVFSSFWSISVQGDDVLGHAHAVHRIGRIAVVCARAAKPTPAERVCAAIVATTPARCLSSDSGSFPSPSARSLLRLAGTKSGHVTLALRPARRAEGACRTR